MSSVYIPSLCQFDKKLSSTLSEWQLCSSSCLCSRLVGTQSPSPHLLNKGTLAAPGLQLGHSPLPSLAPEPSSIPSQAWLFTVPPLSLCYPQNSDLFSSLSDRQGCSSAVEPLPDICEAPGATSSPMNNK